GDGIRDDLVTGVQTCALPILKVRAKVLDLASVEKANLDATVDAGPDSTQKVLTLPELKDSPVHFLSVTVEDAAGKVVGSNFYWLSTKAETLDFPKSTWFTTPTIQYADF